MMLVKVLLLVLVLVVLLGSSCTYSRGVTAVIGTASNSHGIEAVQRGALGAFVVELNTVVGSISVSKHMPNGLLKQVWRSAVPPSSSATKTTGSGLGASFLELHVGVDVAIKGTEGMFDITPSGGCPSSNAVFSTLTQNSASIAIDGYLLFAPVPNTCGMTNGTVPFRMEWSFPKWSNNSIGAKVYLTENGSTLCKESSNVPNGDGSKASIHSCAWTLRTQSSAAQAVYGFGVQYSVWNMKSRVVPILVSEQGVGRGLQPITDILNTLSNNEGGNWHTTYGALPFYMTSNTTSFFLDHSQFSVFDLTSSSSIDAMVYAPDIKWVVDAEETPLELVSEFTNFNGRMRRLPDWVLQGPIIGYYGGTDAVLSLHRNISAMGLMNVTAYWLQDWTGLRDTVFGERLWWNWEVDPELYHDWDGMVATLSKSNTRVMTYINPNLANTVSSHKKNFTHDYFKEAAANGYLVKNSSGLPYIDSSASPDFTFGKVDLTNRAALKWMAGIISSNMIGRGHSGWMSDFGEYLPFDGILSNGTAFNVHNEFPMLWASTNRDAAGSDDDVVFFSRSSYFGSPGASTLFWLGDQLVTFDAYDGLQTVLIGRMTSGLAGYSLSHSDVGGYTMVKELGLKYLRSPELLYRWMDMSAGVDVIFRSHQGNLPTESAQVYSSPASLRCLARATRLHALFVPYRKALMANATTKGHPIVRAMWLQYPTVSEVRDLVSQVMIGSDIVFAPSLSEGQNTVDVVLPVGGWVDVWTNTTIHVTSAPLTKTIQTPVGKPGILFSVESQYLKAFIAGLAFVEEVACML